MTFAKASALGACLVGAVAVGIWVSPYVRERGASVRTEPVEAVAPAPVTPSVDVSEAPAARPVPARAVTKRAATPRRTEPALIGFSPDIHKRLKPLLNQGADMSVAADGFRNAEQFATVAHASRNTEVPFMLLKHRVLNEGMTLPAAILASNPNADATAEANRAKAEAKVDLAAESQVANRE